MTRNASFQPKHPRDTTSIWLHVQSFRKMPCCGTEEDPFAAWSTCYCWRESPSKSLTAQLWSGEWQLGASLRSENGRPIWTFATLPIRYFCQRSKEGIHERRTMNVLLRIGPPSMTQWGSQLVYLSTLKRIKERAGTSTSKKSTLTTNKNYRRLVNRSRTTPANPHVVQTRLHNTMKADDLPVSSAGMICSPFLLHTLTLIFSFRCCDGLSIALEGN